jgi:hypothetical protein
VVSWLPVLATLYLCQAIEHGLLDDLAVAALGCAEADQPDIGVSLHHLHGDVSQLVQDFDVVRFNRILEPCFIARDDFVTADGGRDRLGIAQRRTSTDMEIILTDTEEPMLVGDGDGAHASFSLGPCV